MNICRLYGIIRKEYNEINKFNYKRSAVAVRRINCKK